MLMLSPLEQFEIVPLIILKFEELDFSFTNFLLISLISLVFLGGKTLKSKEGFFLIFLFSKTGSQIFPLVWCETFISRLFPRVLGIMGGLEFTMFARSYIFLILIFLVC